MTRRFWRRKFFRPLDNKRGFSHPHFNFFTAFPLEEGSCEKIDFVLFHVIPAKAGIQCFQGIPKMLDPGFHRGDG
jgi:hypothetical protein